MDNSKLKECVRTFGTPLYIFDEHTLVKRVNFLRAHLPEKTELCYAVKANTFIIPELADLVDSFEVCSPGEKRICENLSIPWNMTVISGVHKDEEMIDSLIATDAPVRAYTVESLNQFHLISKTARRYDTIIPVLLRLTSGNQFGLDAEDIKHLVCDEKDNNHVIIKGIQFFSGTQKDSIKRLDRELSKLDAFLEELKRDCGFAAQILEFGPGFPVDYFGVGKIEDEAVFLDEFAELLVQLKFTGQIVLELGRSIAASCGTYLTSVVDTKKNAGLRYAIVDGGVHHLVYFGHAMAMKQPPVRLLEPDVSNTFTEVSNICPDAQSVDGTGTLADGLWNICGSLCTAYDILVKKISIKNLCIGSVFAFDNAGAYCMTEGMLMFLSRDLPKIAVVDDTGTPQLIRSGLRTDSMNTPGLFI